MTDTVTSLNRLVDLLVDSARGYHEASQVATDTTIQSEFSKMATKRAQLVDRFQDKVEMAGGRSDADGTVSGTAHRMFLNVRSLFQNDTKAAIAEVERGEDALKEAFEDVLRDDDVTDDVRSFVRSVYPDVKSDHDKWSAMKQQFERM